jgi:hypothetical protein
MAFILLLLCSCNFHSLPTLYVNILEENAVNIHSVPLAAFHAGMEEGGKEVDENEVEEMEVLDVSNQVKV